jgi:hypothetical protein
MKKSLISSSWTILAAVAISVGGGVGAEIVYNNSTNDLYTRFNPGQAEVGDEIILSGSSRTITTFVLQYWAVGLGGGETARVRFYANNGTNAPADPGILVPNSLLFDSGNFSIADTARSTLVFTDFITGAATPLTTDLPDSFTWSVQFYGTDGAGESAGVDLYSPPTVGGNHIDYWDNAGSFDWRLRFITVDGTNPPASFGALVEAIPEPATLWLGLFGGLAILGLKYRRR